MTTSPKHILPLAVFVFSFSYNLVAQPLNKLKYDESTTAILPYRGSGNWPIFHNYRASSLTQSDLTIIDSLFKIAIEEHNSGIGYIAGEKIDQSKKAYKRQIIAALKSNGEKEVWINCFCEAHDSNWREKIIEIDDGGSCFFNLKINITLRKYYDFMVNGSVIMEAGLIKDLMLCEEK